jgi:hypothetical protein
MAPANTCLRNTLAVMLFVMGGLLCSEVAAHPSHVTIAEAEWNAKSKSLEIAVRVNVADLEKGIRRQSKSAKKIVLKEGESNAEREVKNYVNSRLAIYTKDEKRLKLKWVGMEVEIHHGWLYFEFPMRNPPSSIVFENRLFLELEKDQVNTLMFKTGSSKKTVHFTQGKTRRELALTVKAND